MEAKNDRLVEGIGPHSMLRVGKSLHLGADMKQNTDSKEYFRLMLSEDNSLDRAEQLRRITHLLHLKVSKSLISRKALAGFAGIEKRTINQWICLFVSAKTAGHCSHEC